MASFNKNRHFVYWLGEDRNIWIKQDGNVFNAGKIGGAIAKAAVNAGGSITNFDKGLKSVGLDGTMINNPNKTQVNFNNHFVYWLGEDGKYWFTQDGKTFSYNPGQVSASKLSNGTRINNPNPSSSASSSSSKSTAVAKNTASKTSGGSGSYASTSAAKATVAANKKANTVKQAEIDNFVNNYRDSLKQQYDANVANLQQQRSNNMASIMSEANRAGMMYSNFPERSKIQYEANTYTPALANVKKTYQTGLDTLRANAADIKNQTKSIEEAITHMNSL